MDWHFNSKCLLNTGRLFTATLYCSSPLLPVVHVRFLFVLIMNTTLGNRTGSTSCVESSYTGYAFTSVSIFGSLGNILVIFSICRQYFYKNTHYYIVLHLSICDLLNLFTGVTHSYRHFTGKNLDNVGCTL
jgi:uncharacterized membrane-anchored protein